METKRGRLFVIEGSDGSGKATQRRKLVKNLIKQGYTTKSWEFPQYDANIFADTVSDYLSDKLGKATEVNPYLISPLYAADRWMASSDIRKAMDDGAICVLDRYASANMGHQGAKISDPEKRHEFFEWERAMEYGERGFRIPVPDLTVLLDVDPAVSRKLVDARGKLKGREKDGHEKRGDYLEAVTRTFLELARSDPTWRIINCMGRRKNLLDENTIAKKVWETVQPYLPPMFPKNNH